MISSRADTIRLTLCNRVVEACADAMKEGAEVINSFYLSQPSPSYQFGFDVKDDEFTNYQNRKESREGNVIKGSYSVVDSDGFM